jgi:hypothetical protein
MPDVLAEAVHSGEACGASVSDLMREHLPSEQPENVFEDVSETDQVQTSSMPPPLIAISDRVLDSNLSAVKTTISNPEQLAADREKYHQGQAYSSCDCQSCKARVEAFQQQTQNAPITVTPYRHNWIISGSHKDSAEDDDFLNMRNCCQIQ